MIGPAASKQSKRAGRRDGRDGWRLPVTTGLFSGMGGSRPQALFRAYLAIAALVALVDSVNVLTILEDASRRGQELAVWEPIVLEFTSGICELSASFIIYAALRLAPLGHGAWARTLSIHAAASVIFSILHVGAMTFLRLGIYAALGFRYRSALSELPYEYRKDLLAYLILAGVFRLFLGPARAEPITPPKTTPTSPPTFDIVDGSTILRVLVRDIISVRAAGNYAEFLLEDGRQILMRTPLRDIEQVLTPQGFVRTHRSWIVNGSRVRSLTSAGSGDFRVELEGGIEAPLSRRFPDALARLRVQPLAL
jgi:hypothetical protein